MLNRITNAAIEYKKELKEFKKQKREDFNIKLELDLLYLKEHYPNLDFVYILGFTPKWNDGEECLHGTNIYIRNSTKTYSDVSEYFQMTKDWDYELSEEEQQINTNLSEKEISSIHDIINNVVNNIDILYETDFNFIIDFTKDQVQVQVEHYESEY